MYLSLFSKLLESQPKFTKMILEIPWNLALTNTVLDGVLAQFPQLHTLIVDLQYLEEYEIWSREVIIIYFTIIPLPIVPTTLHDL